MAYIKFEKVKLKSGVDRWEGYAEGPPHPVTGKRQQIRRRGKTQNEVKTKILIALRELEESIFDVRKSKKITFAQVADKWFETYQATGVKGKTINTRRYQVQTLKKYLGDIPILNITFSVYQDLINKLAKKLERSTIKGLHSCAQMIFKYAKKDGIIKNLPSEDIVIPKKILTVEEIEQNTIEEKYLTTKELNEFLKAVREHGLDLDLERFYLLAFTGMRSGELCALKWSDINFKNKTIRITKTLYSETNSMKNYELTPPKTKKSIRTFEVVTPVMNLLKAHRNRQLKLKVRYRDHIEHDADFVFCRLNGYPFTTHDVNQRMKRLLKFTDINKSASPHIFRHTYISMLAESGVDLKLIMDKVGHDDVRTTMQIYTHVTEKMRTNASKKISATFDNFLGNISF